MRMPSILFVLPVKGGGGGANSVVQESLGLARLGVTAAIACNSNNYNSFVTNYPELQGRVKIEPFAPGQLGPILTRYEVVIATINNSVREIRDALAKAENPPRLAYYVQDYEPLFYPPESPEWQTARESYTLVRDILLLAKTAWLQRMVYENHGVRVAKVEPSIDHDVFFPNLTRPTDMLSIVAMVRPKTPRRAPQRTMRLMQMLAERFDEDVSLQIFGATNEELAAEGYDLNFGVINRGVLRRTDVPNLLRNADLFLDLSDYQAFGRTGLEAMASGCVPVVPIMGGADEYAIHGYNGYLVDSRSEAEILAAIESFVALTPEGRMAMRLRGIETASRYSVQRAALSELQVFMDSL